jgi:cytoskeleton protein RodZ
MKHTEKTEHPSNRKISAPPAAEHEAGQLAFFAAETAGVDADPPADPQTSAPALYTLLATAEVAEAAPDPSVVVEDSPPPAASVRVAESLGQRLAAAREARGWSCDEVARKLRLPLQVVRTIETDHYERIGSGVYLRGYLTSYARLVDVPTVTVENVLRQHASTPELVASGRISHSRYLIDRYSGSALYVVLTGMIVVPFVMFAMNMGGDVGARFTPLDVPAAAATAVNSEVADAGKPAADQSSAVTTGTASAPAGTASNDAPLMASFTPFANAPQQVTTSIGQAKLSLNEASWVEIVDVDGKRLEYGILPAGTVKSYASDKPLDVRLGNTNGARLEANGAVQDITPYNHGNVAHFKLFVAGKTISHTD